MPIFLKPPHALTVNFQGTPGYPQEHITLQGIEVVDRIQCDWDDRILLAREFLGGLWGSFFYEPQPYPTQTDPLYYVLAKEVSIEGIGIASTPNKMPGKYAKAQLTIGFSDRMPELPEPGETTFITESIEPASEFITLNTKGFEWADGTPVETNEAPGLILRMVNWVYTLHQLTTIPSWVWILPGCVNDDIIVSNRLNKTFGVDTLLCGNPSLIRDITSQGTKGWTITVRMMYRPQGWNYFPRTDKITAGHTLAFEPIYEAGAVNKKYFYTPTDFSVIVG